MDKVCREEEILFQAIKESVQDYLARVPATDPIWRKIEDWVQEKFAEKMKESQNDNERGTE